MNAEPKLLTGQTQNHVVAWGDSKILVHKEIVAPLERLVSEAETEGFELQICSGFRSFDSQLAIWNGKIRGERPVLDSMGKPLPVSQFSFDKKLEAILRWSSLPGISRHHWGTDLDVYDKAALPEDYTLQLIPGEFEGDGFSAPLHDWLDWNLKRFGFYRPYAKDHGGVSPERWHISYSPLAQHYWEMHSAETLLDALQIADIEYKVDLLPLLPQIFERYFKNIDLAKNT